MGATFYVSSETQAWADLQDCGNAQSQLVLQALARHADWDTGFCCCRASTLARMAKCSVKTTRRHLKRLEADGVIAIKDQHRDDGSQGANKYLLLGYAEWISANRLGGKVPKPRRAGRYAEADLGHDDDPRLGQEPEADETQQNGRGHVDQGGGQADHGAIADDASKAAVVNVTRGGGQQMTRGPGQQVTTPRVTPSLNSKSEPVVPPLPPNGGESEIRDWKGRTLDTLRSGGRNLDAIESLIAPLLASDKRLSLGKETVPALRELAEAAHGIPTPALAAAVKRLIEQPSKLTPQRIRKEIDIAKRSGALVVLTRGSPQWKAWHDHVKATDPNAARTIARFDKWQFASEWPPGKSEGKAA